MAKVITITSGKGGVGKTNASTNIAISLASNGHKVCLFDADTGLANVNILLGLKPEATLEEVISGEKRLDEIILRAQRGLKVIPAASGIAACAELDPQKRARLIESLQQLEEQFDYILIDTAAGIGENVLDFVSSSDYPIIVVTPEPTSLTDAFAMVKMLKKRDHIKPLYVLVNMARDFDNSMEVFNRFKAAVDKYLNTEVYYLGYVALDENVIASVSFQFPAVIMKADAPASLCFKKLASVIEKQFIDIESPAGFSRYWKETANEAVAEEPIEIEAPAQAEQQSEATDTPQAEKQPVVTDTPQPIQPFIGNNGLPTETLADSALRLLNEHETKQQSAKSFLEPLIKTYIDRFESFPFDPYQSLYQQLEMLDFPKEEIRELVSTLESLFEKQHNSPLRNLDSTIIKLLADARGSEEKVTLLNQQLKSSFKRQFKRPLNNPLDEFVESVKESDFSEEDYKAAQQAQQQAFLNRFGKPYKDEKDLLIEQLRADILSLNQQKEQAGQLLAEFSSTLKQTDQLRDRLSQLIAEEPCSSQAVKSEFK